MPLLHAFMLTVVVCVLLDRWVESPGLGLQSQVYCTRALQQLLTLSTG